MAIDYAFVLKKLRSLKEIHVPYAVATNMPFVTCDEETFNDQIWLFTSVEAVKEFAKKYEEKKILFKGVCVKQESMQAFYMDLHAMGVNEVVFCDGGVEHKLELHKMVQIPDFKKLPIQQRPLMNPELQLSTVYFFQEVRRQGVEPDAERLESLAEEMYANLAKARFLLPVQVMPTDDKKGTINLPYITDKNGNKFQPIFSDHTQYMKHVKKNKLDHNTRVLMLGISDLQKYVVPDAQGYMLDPDGYCHPLNKQQIEFILEKFGK